MHEAIIKQAAVTPHATAVLDASSGLAFTFENVVNLARSFAAAIADAENCGRLDEDQVVRGSQAGHPVAVYMKKDGSRLWVALRLTWQDVPMCQFL